RRHLAFVSQFTDDVSHLPGSSNIIADALSRSNPQEELVDSCSFEDQFVSEFPSSETVASVSEVFSHPSASVVRSAQEADVGLLNWIQRHLDPATPFEPRLLPSSDDSGVDLWFDVSNSSQKLLVPSNLQENVFHVIHSPSHSGFKATYKALANRFYWPTIKRDVKSWCKSCLGCQRNKV
ncbi:Hypothetical predicted protein, partial [Paramuricea clavata]